MSNAEYARSLLLTSPYIQPESEMCINFISDSPTSYSIDSEPARPIVKRYLSGDSIRQYVFSLVARYPVITDEIRAISARNYEYLTSWFETQTKRRALPDMGGGATAQKIETIGNAYIMERAKDNDSALYVMQCALTYFQKAGNY